MDTLCKKLVWAALLLIIGQSGFAQVEVSKKVEETFKVNDAGEFHLENKYGNIKFYGWEKDEVSVVVSITVNHRKMDNAKDLLNRISTVVRKSDNYASMSYEIAEKNNGWFSKLFDEANPFDFNRSNIQIDYTVHVPKKVKLNVTNTFGDVFIENWQGELKGKIEHGDIWLSDDLNKANIEMKYGKLRAGSINYGNLKLTNSDLDMKDSKSLRINSSGTEMIISKVNSFEFYSNKDEVSISEVGTIYGTLKFTTLELNRLKTTVDMTLRVADFRIMEILDPKVDIAIEQESSEVNLNVRDFSHRFKATLEQGLVRLPKSFKNVESKMLDKGKKLREIQADYGDNQEGSITINGRKGVVLLKEM